MSGAMVVPLCVEHPTAELDYIISDCGAKIILAHSDFFHLIENSSCAKKSSRLQNLLQNRLLTTGIIPKVC